jgi:hypothetical protein
MFGLPPGRDPAAAGPTATSWPSPAKAAEVSDSAREGYGVSGATVVEPSRIGAGGRGTWGDARLAVSARGWVGHRRLPDNVVRASYPWLPKINPLYSRGGDFFTNCVLAAIGTDLTLKEAMLDPDEDPALRVYYQVSPSERVPREHIRNMGKGDPVAVPEYAAIVDAMTRAGRGARGIVIVDQHVFNVVHDENDVVFLDGQKGRQAVVPARFQSLEFLPTSDGFPRESIAVNPTPGRPYPFLGAYAPEFETPIRIHGLPPEVVGTSGFVLAVNKRLGYQAKIDKRPFFRDTEGTYHPDQDHFEQSGKKLAERISGPVVEFVPMPWGATGRPRDARAGDRATVMESIRAKLDALAVKVAEHPDRSLQLPARELFSVEEGWEFYPAQEGWEKIPEGAADTTMLEVLPVMAPGGETLVLYPQYTAGVPLAEMHEFLRWALTKVPNWGAAERTAPEEMLQQGLDFGDEIAQRFVKWRFRVKVPQTSLDVLGEIESVPAIRGMVALLYPHIVALMGHHLLPENLSKNWLLAASRVAFAGIRKQLPDDAKTFLEKHAHLIRDSLLHRFRLFLPDYERDYYKQASVYQTIPHFQRFYTTAKQLPDGRIDLLTLPIAGEEMTVGDYLDNALLDHPTQRVDQTDAIGMLTQFDEADTNNGQLTVALIPVELRGFGPSPTDIDNAEKSLTSIDEVLGRMYDRAQRRRDGIEHARIDALLAAAGATAIRGRPLPTPPSHTQIPASSNVPDGRRPDTLLSTLRLPQTAQATPPMLGFGWVPAVSQSVPGVTALPSINRETWKSSPYPPQREALKAALRTFVQQAFPALSQLNPTGSVINCSQAVVAVDYMFNGDTQVRIPPSGPRFKGDGWSGLHLLQDQYRGRWVPVSSYDDIILHISRMPGSRGIVFLGNDLGEAHFINVTNTSAGVVFLDGQAADLGELPLSPRATYVGLMMYHPANRRPPAHENVPAAGRHYDRNAQSEAGPFNASGLSHRTWTPSGLLRHYGPATTEGNPEAEHTEGQEMTRQTNTVTDSDGVVWKYPSASNGKFCVNVAVAWPGIKDSLAR